MYMPNDDFSIKTGINVDDSGIDRLKNLADSLTEIAKSLDKIGNGKVNLDISGLKNIRTEVDKTKKQISELANLLNKKNNNGSNKGKLASIEHIANSNLNVVDPKIYTRVEESLNNAATAAAKIKDALGGDVSSGLLTQINEMLDKKDELLSLANILKSNKDDINKVGKAAGVKSKNAVSKDVYDKNDVSWLKNGRKYLENKYNGKTIGASINQTESGIVKLTTSIKTAEGEWYKLSAQMDADGKITKVTPKSIDSPKEINRIENAMQEISSGNRVELTIDEMNSKKAQVREILKEVYSDAKSFNTEIDSLGRVSISKIFPDGEEINNLKVQYDNVDEILDEWKNSADKAKDIQEMFSFASVKTSKANPKNTSSSTSEKPLKYTTDQSYVGDYKTLIDNEAMTQVVAKFRTHTAEIEAAIKERQDILDRANAKTPQNSTEINTKQKFDDLSKTVTDNLSKYETRIKSAYDAFDKIKSEKSGIAGIGDVFASSEEQINKWAAAVAKGKMGIDEFEKKVNGLNGSVGSIGKIIDPASITDAKGELESYLKELTGIQDITFSGFTEKNGISSLKGTFKDSAGEAQTLSVQLNTLNGQIKNLGTSVKPAESGLSKFFSGWKEKMVNLAQYLTSFQAMNQIWNTFKQGLEVVKEFDTALTEMRKVSDEPISKLKEFQKESFDMAKSVGTTALQIQNSTADFMRLGQSMEEAKQSSVNANRLMNVSEFDNIDDATSALISMKAAYKDLSEESIIDKLNNIGNSYAVSTDELATGLQKSGAALSLMGNNIDESVALLTSANTQIQDISSVAAGVKTISLRIAGRSCLNILKGMGGFLYSLVDNYIGGVLGTDNTEVRPIFI